MFEALRADPCRFIEILLDPRSLYRVWRAWRQRGTTAILAELSTADNGQSPGVLSGSVSIGDAPIAGTLLVMDATLRYPPKENGLFVKQNWIQPPFNHVEKQALFEWIDEINEPNGRELKPIVIAEDSFFDGMSRTGICIYFKKIYKAKWGDVKIAELVKNLPTDCKYLFLEFIEVNNGSLTELAAESQSK